MILMDGKALKDKMLGDLEPEFRSFSKPLSLAVVEVGENEVVSKFVSQKKKAAQRLGVDFREYRYAASISTNELRKRIAAIVHDAEPAGLIIQLPLPSAVNARYILNAIPPEKDVDVLSARSLGGLLSGKTEILPPVVGAAKLFFDEYEIGYKTKSIVLIGAGELVGKPLAAWLLNEGATFSVVRSTTSDLGLFTKNADIVISGVGKPGLITGDMIKEGAVVIDAGTSESEGKLSGDAELGSVSKKAAYLTPVPGGVGPVTVAIIFKNLLALAKKRKR